MTDFDPVERDLRLHLEEEERAERFQAALDHEYAEVWAENFEFGREDHDSLADALADYMGELATHILRDEYGPARAIVENAIVEWCKAQARMRVEAQEEIGRSNTATRRRDR